MRDVATLAAGAVEQFGRSAGERIEAPLIRKLFLMLHGAYGNQFAAKYGTGVVVEEGPDKGKDKGIRAAMLVWDAALAKYPGDVVELAAKRLVKDNPKFPPNLGELEIACEAAMPRKTYFQEAGLPRLPAPLLAPVHVVIDPVGDGKDWARKILARAQAGDKTLRLGAIRDAAEALRYVGGFDDC